MSGTAGAETVFDEDRPAEPAEADRPLRPLAAGRLTELTVRDLALIEKLRISFEPGLNVLTGETGAGKSLLIDALGLALGARADPGLVRHGADTARVEALFDRLPEPLVCVREVAAGGRSVARIAAASPVTSLAPAISSASCSRSAIRRSSSSGSIASAASAASFSRQAATAAATEARSAAWPP